MKTLLCILLITSSFAYAEDKTWQFVWTSSHSKGWSSVTGKAELTWNGSEFEAKMYGSDTTEFLVKGTSEYGEITAKFTALETDFHINSLFTGKHHKERDKDFIHCGIETIALTDGYNFIGLRRDFHDDECQP